MYNILRTPYKLAKINLHTSENFRYLLMIIVDNIGFNSFLMWKLHGKYLKIRKMSIYWRFECLIRTPYYFELIFLAIVLVNIYVFGDIVALYKAEMKFKRTSLEFCFCCPSIYLFDPLLGKHLLTERLQ